MAKLKIGVLIINNNDRQSVKRCLQSVQRTDYENLEVFVLDNDCDPVQGTKKMGREVKLPLAYEKSRECLTRAAAYNQLIDKARLGGCELIWCLNQYCMVYKNSCTRIVKAFGDDRVAMVGSRWRRSKRLVSGGGKLGVLSLAIGETNNQVVRNSNGQYIVVDWIGLDNLVAKTDMIIKAGGFNTSFYMSFEDLDL